MKRYFIWLPLLIVLLWFGKNWYYFNTFSASSWGPMSQYKLTLYDLPQATRDSLYHAGKISIYSTQEPFARLWHYGVPVTTPDSIRTTYFPRTPHKFIPVLDQTQFDENGSNMNHWLYLEAEQAQAKDNSWAMNHYPKLYWGNVLKAMRISLRPASTWFEVGSNHPQRQNNLNALRKAFTYEK